MMRILFLDQFAELGGAQRSLAELLPAVDDAGWEPHVAVPGDGGFVRLLRERSIPVHNLSLGSYSLGRKSLWDAARFLYDLGTVASEIRSLSERLEPTVVYVNGPRLMPAVSRAGLGRPVVFHAHNYVSAWNGRFLVAAALRRTDATVIAATRFVARQWNRPARVVYGGVEGPGEKWSRAPKKTGPRIGLIGRFAPSKCQKEFVLAATELEREWPSAEFILCGDARFGDNRGRRYKNKVLAVAPPSVRSLGWRDDVYEVLARRDLLVAPSTTEGGIPFVILEAFAAGVPVLASAVGDTAEVIVDGQNGFLLLSPTASTIARRLRELVPQSDRLAAVSACAYRLWQDKFTVERYRREIWEVVASVGSGA